MRYLLWIFTVFLGVVSSNFVLADDQDVNVDEELEIIIDTGIEETNEIAYQLNGLGWCPDDNFDTSTETTPISIDQETETIPDGTHTNRGYADERIMNLCQKIREMRDLDGQLSDNMKELEDNAKRMKEKETSFENRALGAVGIGTVGIGGMMAASALSEQNADKAAEQDMAAYLATFRCSYAPGKSVKGGPDPIELPGGNDTEFMNLRNEYMTLASSLKERKESLGMKPGLESEEILDKSQMGLYDDENVGITDGAYASIYRAQTGNEKDQEKLNQQSEATDKKLKTGATVAVLGAVATAVGNYALNHNNKNRSEEILAKRKEIKSNYDTVVQELISECNKTIQGHRDVVKKLPAKVFENQQMKQYKQDVLNAKDVSTLAEIKESMFCK